MSYAYSRSAGASSLPSFNSIPSSEGLVNQACNRVIPAAKQWIEEGVDTIRSSRPRTRDEAKNQAKMVLKSLFSIPSAVVLLWVFTLWWGERTVFQESIDACAWEAWETWPKGATPHRIAFVADPQLVDPHTYPGRPWPLSTLTVQYTDQYMRRSFSHIQKNLVPDSVLFLGDLFDGGREWATSTTTSPEERYKKIGDSFWKKEYGRFMKIFLDPWLNQEYEPFDSRGRKLIASLPGNHDLGFGNGIQEPVRQRFQAYFGEGNRVDIIGNHTFVSVDTPSLSARDQPDPETGSSSSSNKLDEPWPLWKDADDFLNQASLYKAKAETEELLALKNHSEQVKFEHRIVDAVEDVIKENPKPKSVGFPTILLTHVPLFRKPATPCGPLRERSPPAAPGLEEDEPNALKITGGYQYQNVLTPTISTELVNKAGPNVVQVYSGDDHDYCEISHREFNGSPNEITVKSISWAMGVRHPGFVLTSLWNPIDPQTGESTQKGSQPTIQNHLCLLPDQLGIFIHYAVILGLSMVILFISSTYHIIFAPEIPSSDSYLPLTERRSHSPRHQYQASGTSSSTLPSLGGLASRGGLNAPRYPGAKSHYDTYRGPDRDDIGSPGLKVKPMYRPARAVGVRQHALFIGRDFIRSVRIVAGVVLSVYFILIWRW
ncbi:hypothetical protein N7526_011064 [Penicillium atrosanguineum]|nr:hypothetical protein N7526_011064 [Penicillium atrosanguineum]